MLTNFGYCRFVWNQMLNMQSERYKNGGSYVSKFGMTYLLPCLKKEYSFLKLADATSLQQVCVDLDHDFAKLFKKHKGYPNFKSRRFPRQSYYSSCNNNSVRELDSIQIKLPKLGSIPFKAGRNLEGKVKGATVRLSATGKFYACVLCDTEIKHLPKTHLSVGLDMGVADLMISSDGVK